MVDDLEPCERGPAATTKLGETREGLDSIDQEFSELTIQTGRAGIWARDGMSLRDRVMVTCAVLIALGREPMAMKPNIRRAIRQGISDREFREMLYQTINYAGWSLGGPAMRNYLEVLAEFMPNDLPSEYFEDAARTNEAVDLYQRGLEVLDALGESPRDGLNDIDQEFSDITITRIFGQFWGRDGLGLRDRALITLAVVVALNREPMAMKPNFRRAIRTGVTDRAIG